MRLPNPSYRQLIEIAREMTRQGPEGGMAFGKLLAKERRGLARLGKYIGENNGIEQEKGFLIALRVMKVVLEAQMEE